MPFTVHMAVLAFSSGHGSLGAHELESKQVPSAIRIAGPQGITSSMVQGQYTDVVIDAQTLGLGSVYYIPEVASGRRFGRSRTTIKHEYT